MESITNKNNFFALLLQDVKKLINHHDVKFLEEAINILINITKDMGSINNEIQTSLTHLQRVRESFHSDEKDYDKIRTFLRNQIQDSIPNFIKTREQLQTISIYSTQLILPEGLSKEVFIEDNMRNLAWGKKLIECSKSVCRIRVISPDKEFLGYGTGFIVEGEYLFTCNHVIESVEVAHNSIIEFNYERDSNHRLMTPVEYSLDPTDFFTDEQLDYTRVKIKHNPSNPISNFGYLKISKTKPNVKSKISVIHHPEGKEKHISILGNQISDIENSGAFSFDFEQSIQYDASTEKGSSGSPIFNDKWEVIGIHNEGYNKEKVWYVKKSFNKATLISNIEEDIKKKSRNSKNT